MKPTTLVILFLFAPAVVLAQTGPPTQTPPSPPAAAPPPAPDTPAAVGGTKVAVLDVQRAIAENSEGKKAIAQLNSEGQKRQGELEKKQKEIEEAQNKLRTQDKLLADAAKADLQRQIERDTTTLQRATDDAQREMQELQNKLFATLFQITDKVLKAYAAEMGFAVVFDVSSQTSNIVYNDPVADITTEIIRRVDAELAKTPKPPEPTKK